MKRLLISISILTCFAAVLTGIFWVRSEKNAAYRNSVFGKGIAIQQLDRSPFILDTASGGNLLLILFHSTCDECKSQIDEIIKNYPVDGGFRMLLISDEPLDTLLTFRKRSGLYAISNISVLRDSSGRIGREFNVTIYPTSLVFDSNRRLRKMMHGVHPYHLLVSNLK